MFVAEYIKGTNWVSFEDYNWDVCAEWLADYLHGRYGGEDRAASLCVAYSLSELRLAKKYDHDVDWEMDLCDGATLRVRKACAD